MLSRWLITIDTKRMLDINKYKRMSVRHIPFAFTMLACSVESERERGERGKRTEESESLDFQA